MRNHFPPPRVETCAQLAAYSLPEDRSNPLLICSSAGFLEVLRGVPDEETEEFKTLHRGALRLQHHTHS